MPIVRIEMWEGREDEMKENLIKDVTEATAKSLEIPKDHVRVILFEVPRKHWGVGGVPTSKTDWRY